MEQKRLFIGGLYPSVKEEDLQERFSRYGEVSSIEIKKRKDSDGQPSKTFAYMNITTTDADVKKCISTFNNVTWKGGKIKMQLAKENFLHRLEEEREQALQESEPSETSRKRKQTKSDAVLVEPLRDIPGIENFHLKGAPPGPLPGQENWVVAKYGRVLPVVQLKKKGSRKMLKVDPSKLTHNVKKFAEEAGDLRADVSSLTWQLEATDNDITKRRKGEFPEWKAPVKKRKTVKAPVIENVEREVTVVSGNVDGFEIAPLSFSVNKNKELSMSSKTNTERKPRKCEDLSRFNSDSDSGEEFSKTTTDSKPRKVEDLSRFNSDSDSGEEMDSLGKTGSDKSSNRVSSKTGVANRSSKKEKKMSKTNLEGLVTNKTIHTEIVKSPAHGRSVSSGITKAVPSRNRNLVHFNAMDEYFSGITHSQDFIGAVEQTVTDSGAEKTDDEYSDFESFVKAEEVKLKRLHPTHGSDSTKSGKIDTPGTMTDKSVTSTDKAVRRYTSDSDDVELTCIPSAADTPGDTRNMKSVTKPSNTVPTCRLVAQSKVSDDDSSEIISSRASDSVKSGYDSDEECSSSSSDESSSDDSVEVSKRESGLAKVKEKSIAQEVKFSTEGKDIICTEKGNVSNIKNEKTFSTEERNSFKNQSNVKLSKEVEKKSSGKLYCSKETVISDSEDDSGSSSSASSSSDNDDDDDESDDDGDGSLSSASSSRSESGKKLENGSENKSTNEVENVVTSDQHEHNARVHTESGVDKAAKNLEPNPRSSEDSMDNESASEEDSDSDSDFEMLIAKEMEKVDSSKSVKETEPIVSNKSDENKATGVQSLEDGKRLLEEKIQRLKPKDNLEQCHRSDSSDSDNEEESFTPISTKKLLVKHSKGVQQDKPDTDTNIKVDRKDSRVMKTDTNIKVDEKDSRVTETGTNIKVNKKDCKVIKTNVSFEDQQKTEKKRMEAVKQRQKEHTAKQGAIREALSNMDSGVQTNKKVVFGSDDNEEEMVLKTFKQTDRKTAALVKETDTSQATQKVNTLFDSSSDSEDDADKDRSRFNIRPELEGSGGKKLMKLQARFGNDERFKLTANFAESDTNSDDSDQDNSGDEKTKSLKILQSVVNTDMTKLVDKTAKQKKKFKDVSQLKYDPSKKDHSQFEIEDLPQENSGKKSKKKKKKLVDDEPLPVPEVSKEKFYEVSNAVIDTFAKKDTQQTGQGFSLLAAFGTMAHDNTEDMETEANAVVPLQSVLPPNSEDKHDDSMKRKKSLTPNTEKEEIMPGKLALDRTVTNRSAQDKSMTDKPAKEKSMKDESATGKSTPEQNQRKLSSTFFFTQDDSRLTEGQQFYRQEDMEAIQERWRQKRPELIQSYKNKQKVMKRRLKVSGGGRGDERRGAKGGRGGARGGRGGARGRGTGFTRGSGRRMGHIA